MIDQFGRDITYMRLSVTDRCNLRCRYCMPEGVELVSMKDILTYEEMLEICAAAVSLGIRTFKITGGDPLVRKGCAGFIAALKSIPGVREVTMTTNGVLLDHYITELLAAGLDAVNISLDTLDPGRFREISGRDELDAVKKGISAALDAGIKVKINTVLQKGVNDDEWLRLAMLAEDRRLDVRFIEMMPIGFGRESEGVSNEFLRGEMLRLFPAMKEDLSVHGNGPAAYVKIPGWKGGIGFISPIYGKFCGKCNRVRVTSQGRLKPCLCFGESVNLMTILRGKEDADKRKRALEAALEQCIYHKPGQHCFEEPEKISETARMVNIGG